MEQKTKKQHYLPQFYLKSWELSDKHQIYVYDKELDSFRINNIKDVASERYFYDFKLNDFLPNEELQMLHNYGYDVDVNKELQLLEHAFSAELEAPASFLIEKILGGAKTATPWHINNCFFISEQEKNDLSAFLSFQFIRIKHVRDAIMDGSDCLVQILTNIGASQETIDKFTISKEQAKRIHLSMILDKPHLSELVESFNRLTWMLGINKTNKPFLTSDHPIGTYGHIKHQCVPMNGILSKGVEVFFPLSPNAILLMVDGDYHTILKSKERRYITIETEDEVDFYNSNLALQARRFVFSLESEMPLVIAMKKRNPDIFRQPQAQLKWGDSIYCPR